MNVIDAILHRRSGRNYTDEAIPAETLEEVLRAGLLAPSGKNQKPVELIAVTDRETLTKLSACKNFGSGMLKTAAAAVVVIGNTASDTWVEDGSVAMTCMMLRATELGLANCWVQLRLRQSTRPGVTAPEAARELLGIPEKYGILAVLSLGNPTAPQTPHTLEDADFGKVHRQQY